MGGYEIPWSFLVSSSVSWRPPVPSGSRRMPSSSRMIKVSDTPHFPPSISLGKWDEEGYHMPTVGLCARSLHSLPHPNRFNLNDNSQGRKDRSHRLSATLSAGRSYNYFPLFVEGTVEPTKEVTRILLYDIDFQDFHS